jgi:hypothetical protein
MASTQGNSALTVDGVATKKLLLPTMKFNPHNIQNAATKIFSPDTTNLASTVGNSAPTHKRNAAK